MNARDVHGVEPSVWALSAVMVFIATIVAGSFAAQLPDSVIGAKESLKQMALIQIAAFGFALVLAITVVVLIRRTIVVELSCATCAYPLRGLQRVEGTIRCPECGTAYTPDQSAAMTARLSASKRGVRTGLSAGPMDLPRGLVALLAVAPFYVFVSSAATWIDGLIRGEQPDPVKHTTLKMLNEALAGPSSADRAWAWVVIASVVTLVPAVEELLYRGFVQSFVVRTMTPDGPRWRAVVMTSLLFAVMHVATGVVPWSAAAPLFVLSIGLGLAFERTGRLGVPIVMHGLFNAANVAVVVVARP